MSLPWVYQLVPTKEQSLLVGFEWLARGIFKPQGYQWEVRRNGELKLGYWRKTLRTRNQKHPYPKRFVLIPGFGDSPLSWSGVISLLWPILRRNFDEVILFDLPGFGGRLCRDKCFPSMDIMMTSVNDALDSLKPHTILGHSLGGWLTGHYAALCGNGNRPLTNKTNYSGPESILVMNSSGIYPDVQTEMEFEIIFRRAMKEGGSALRPHLFKKEPWWFQGVSSFFHHLIQREDIIQFMESVRKDHTLDSIAGQIRSQVWIIWGEKDTLVPSKCGKSWLQKLNPAHREKHHLIFLKDCGHTPQLEKPAITTAVLAQIVSSAQPPHRIGSRWWEVLPHSAKENHETI